MALIICPECKEKSWGFSMLSRDDHIVYRQCHNCRPYARPRFSELMRRAWRTQIVACVAEVVDARDLKSLSNRSGGSSPPVGTKLSFSHDLKRGIWIEDLRFGRVPGFRLDRGQRA